MNTLLDQAQFEAALAMEGAPLRPLADHYESRGWQLVACRWHYSPKTGKCAMTPLTGVSGGQVPFLPAAQTQTDYLTLCRVGGPAASRDVGTGAKPAVRPPPGVTAFDVDHYEGKTGGNTLAAAERELGPLPATFSLTSRGANQPSRRMWFRHPVDLVIPDSFFKQYGGDIETVHTGYRYSWAAPAIHVKNDEIINYVLWYDPDHRVTPMPYVNQLPELPAAWIAAVRAHLARSREVVKAGEFNAEGYVPITREKAYHIVNKAIRELGELPGFGGEFRNRVFGAAFALTRWEIAENGSPDGTEERMEQVFGDLPNHPGLTMDDNDRQHLADGITKGSREPWVFVVDPLEAMYARQQAGLNGQVPPGQPAPAPVPPPVVDPVTALLGELLDVEALANRPKAQPLIDGVLVRNSLARLSGHPGSYKSFLALDWSIHVGLGKSWEGHRVHQGPVVYLVGEGEEGIYYRVRAWEIHHRAKVGDVVRFLPRPVQTSGPEWETFCQAMQRIQPVLIVLDTQARVTVGVNENDPTEFGAMIDRWDFLRRATGATVLLLHHLNADGSRPRGNTAVPGALQSEFEIEKQGPVDARMVKLTNGKQKDNAEVEPLTLRVKVIAVEQPPATGPTDPAVIPDGPVLPVGPVTSVVLHSTLMDRITGSKTLVVGNAADRIHAMMVEHWGEGPGATKVEVRSLVQKSATNPGGIMRKSSFESGWSRLAAEGRIYQPDSKREKFRPVADPPGGDAAAGANGAATASAWGPE